MGGETQSGSLVAHELNAMGYTQLALESQAKASLVQGCASALRPKIQRRERAPQHTLLHCVTDLSSSRLSACLAP